MWKKLEIDGLNKEYLISDNGDIFDIFENKLRKPSLNDKGYQKVSFYIHGKYKRKFVHRLVLSTFKPTDNMESLQVNHIDGNKTNNNVENLEWCTLKENMRHAWDTGLCENSAPTGDASHHKVLSEIQVKNLKRDYYQKHMKIVDIIKKYNISRSTFYQIKNNITWKNV